jgi:hypothetical protein
MTPKRSLETTLIHGELFLEIIQADDSFTKIFRFSLSKSALSVMFCLQFSCLRHFFLDEKVTKKSRPAPARAKTDISFRGTKKTRFAQTVFCAFRSTSFSF